MEKYDFNHNKEKINIALIQIIYYVLNECYKLTLE